MNDHTLSRPTTPIYRDAAGGSVPPDLLGRAATRLQAAAIVYAGAYTLAFGSGMLLTPGYHPPAMLGTSWAFPVLALGFAALLRWRPPPPRTVIDLGLWFEVVGALGIEIGMLFHPTVPAGLEPTGVSWSGVWIVFFPLVVPAPPAKATIAALAAASMMPLMLLILVARGVVLPGVPVLVQFALPNYICVAIAVYGSRFVYGLSSEVREARRMGSYRLTERLGKGGMGEVWRAEHRMLARPAAVKLIRPEALGHHASEDGDRLVQRFAREAQATALLSSPHTVQLHDYGVTSDGTCYYVMELLRGLDLEVFVQRFGPVPAARVADWLVQACESLGEAHERGLIHRDVKPANIYLCRVGRTYDFVKILDFGLVKSLGAGMGEPALTAQHVAAGTPAFMAPEMALADEQLDGRADLYALGCVAYWLLTGRYVFEAETPMQLVVAHVNQEPTPPSCHAELPIPSAFEDAIMGCLAKRREDRPPTADALARATRRAIARDAWTEEDARRWWAINLPEFAR